MQLVRHTSLRFPAKLPAGNPLFFDESSFSRASDAARYAAQNDAYAARYARRISGVAAWQRGAALRDGSTGRSCGSCDRTFSTPSGGSGRRSAHSRTMSSMIARTRSVRAVGLIRVHDGSGASGTSYTRAIFDLAGFFDTPSCAREGHRPCSGSPRSPGVELAPGHSSGRATSPSFTPCERM